MKTALLLLALCACALAAPSPDKSDLARLKAEAARKRACMHDCGAAKFEPLCAGKPGEKPKSFGSECVLHNYNCENNDLADIIPPIDNEVDYIDISTQAPHKAGRFSFKSIKRYLGCLIKRQGIEDMKDCMKGKQSVKFAT